MVGTSALMQALYRLLVKVAPKTAPGPHHWRKWDREGTIARAVHDNSPWKDPPFAPFDCGALSTNIIESEL
ncbi:MAG TPA: sigma 54-interacting transcriptional regulator [Bryobacteraceae bacterium]|nr:sigma 54-interacting transcriptional regulator [Bryobacteraceae bacterium]